MNYLDLDSWNRKEHFDFFKNFESPFFSLVSNVEVEAAYTRCKDKGYSFFLYYHYLSNVAVNEIENFRYRIIEDKVAIFDKIHVGTTIMREDRTFSFSFIPHQTYFLDFERKGKQEVQRIQGITGLGLNKDTSRMDAVYYSTVPWVKFTSVTHATSFRFPDSVPKITFEKIYEQSGRKMMPVSLFVHHALMDGYHAGLYFERFQELLSKGV